MCVHSNGDVLDAVVSDRIFITETDILIIIWNCLNNNKKGWFASGCMYCFIINVIGMSVHFYKLLFTCLDYLTGLFKKTGCSGDS